MSRGSVPLSGVSFANSESFARYPRLLGKDCASLESAGLQSVSRLRLAGASSPPILLAAPGAARDAVLEHDGRRSCAMHLKRDEPKQQGWAIPDRPGFVIGACS
jgi:hypothetical protein